MQNISVRIINEQYETVAWHSINFADVLMLADRLPDFEKRYPWITSIHPYSNTFFNPLQIQYVSEELKRLKKDMLDTDVKKKEFSTNYPGIITDESNLLELDKAIALFESPLDLGFFIELLGD